MPTLTDQQFFSINSQKDTFQSEKNPAL